MAIYIPTTFFSTLGGFLIANFTGIYQGAFLGGGNPDLYYVEGYFTSGSNQYKYHWFRSAQSISNVTNSGSLTIYSGSTAEAKVIIIGGGGGAGYAINGPGGNSAGGGGGGGIVQYDNFVLTPGTYEIVAGAGGAVAGGGSASTNGENSYIKLPSNLSVTPFTSSYIIAGGGGGGASTLVDGGNVSGKTGGSSGGTAIAKEIGSKPTIQSSYNGLGGIQNLTILNQGTAAGGGQYSSGIGYYASGGGGYTGSSNPATAGNIVSNGGDGALVTMYSPEAMAVIPQYAGGGGNAYGRLSNMLQTTSSYGLGTLPDVGKSTGLPLGGGGVITGPINSPSSPNSYNGLGGGVYIEYPWRYTPTASLATNGLVLYNAFNSFSQSIETKTWYDISGNNNHATINGAPMNWNGSGYVFNGVNNYLEYADLDISTGSYTIITYGQFNTNTTTAGYSKYDGATGFLSSFTTSDTYRTGDQGMKLFNSASTQPNTCYALTNNTNFEENWYNGILYRNAEFTPISKTIGNGTFANNNATLKFGYPSTTPAAGYFSGSMNNLLIYNRMLFDWEVENAFLYLSQSMVGANIPTSSVIISPITSSLTLWSNSGSFSGSVWYDVSGNGNNGIISGSAISSSLNGWKFNGINNYVTYPKVLTATPSSSYTLQWYGYNEGTASNSIITRYNIFDKSATGSVAGRLTTYFQNSPPSIANNSNLGVFSSLSNYTSAQYTRTGNKSLYTLVFNGQNNTNTIYLNQTIIYTGSQSSPVFNTLSGSNLLFGSTGSILLSGRAHYSGSVSDLLVYNKPLTEYEICYNYDYFTTH